MKNKNSRDRIDRSVQYSYFRRRMKNRIAKLFGYRYYLINRVFDRSKYFKNLYEMYKYVVEENENSFRVGDLYLTTESYAYDERLKAQQFIFCACRSDSENFIAKWHVPKYCRFYLYEL